MTVFDLEEPVEHRVEGAVEIADGYRVECSCGWLSKPCPSGEVMFDVWSAHATAESAGR